MYIGGDKKKKKPMTIFLMAVVAITIGVGFGFFFVKKNRKNVAQKTFVKTEERTDLKVQTNIWGADFPHHLDSYNAQSQEGIPSPYGGSLPYSQLIRFPVLQKMWQGHPQAKDTNEERGHYYAMEDLRNSKRTDPDFLNKNGLEKFVTGNGNCITCHSAWGPQLTSSLGAKGLGQKTVKELFVELAEKHGNGHFKGQLGVSCADCHAPKTMSLRVTRQAYIKAMVARGYKTSPSKGLEASYSEMRSHVCQQCHSEYYLNPQTAEVEHPWTKWTKGAPFKIEDLHDHYQSELKTKNGFRTDWTHDISGAPMVKVDHPETEMYSSSSHAQSGVSCSDCHMPYKRVSNQKMTDHKLGSPMFNLNSACLTCHAGGEEDMRDRILSMQGKTRRSLKLAERAILSLIDDIKRARPLIEAKAEEDEMSVKKLVNRTLANARMYHRHASLRWDFVASDNSTGFHNPEESQRVLAQAINYAREGQLLLQTDLRKLGLKMNPIIKNPSKPRAPRVIRSHTPPVGSQPPSTVRKFD